MRNPFSYLKCNFRRVNKGHEKILNSPPTYVSTSFENKNISLDDVIAIYWIKKNKLYRLSNYWGSVIYENSIFHINTEYYKNQKLLKKVKILDIPVLGVCDFSQDEITKKLIPISEDNLEQYKDHLKETHIGNYIIFGEHIEELKDSSFGLGEMTTGDKFCCQSHLNQSPLEICVDQKNFKDKSFFLFTLNRRKKERKLQIATETFYLAVNLHYKDLFEEVEYCNKRKLTRVTPKFLSPIIISVLDTPYIINHKTKTALFNLEQNDLEKFKENFFKSNRNLKLKDYNIYLVSNPTQHCFVGYQLIINFNKKNIEFINVDLDTLISIFKTDDRQFPPIIKLFDYTKK